jgi:hypothetical protein
MPSHDIIRAKLQQVEHSLAIMHQYLLVRLAANDWHGVMDASADIRELLVEQRTLKWVLEEQ